MTTEADTCRKYVVPKLQAAGWDTEPHSIAEQRSFTDGRIVVHGNKATRRPGKRADFLLRYTRDFPIAVTEAKPEDEPAASGMQQSKDYAEILKLKFAYATNGLEIIEFDYITGLERKIQNFPTPAELWSRLRASEKLADDSAAQRLLTPFNLTSGKIPHYYQEIAIHRAVQSILQGKRRVLLTMATGTGKTVVAFNVCWLLWSSKWNAKGDATRKPRILYLADRNFLVDDPKDKTFSAFGDARHKIEGGVTVFSRELYFATYQSIARDERRPGLYKQFAPDFFDLIIVDECHRGSAKEDSNWRDILEYFAPAYQLGMTATPLRDDNRDTYLYFGNPIYTYSLREGIDDGFLAPYRVHRIVTQWDAAGWRPSKEDVDRYGRRIPDEAYGTPDFERKVALLKRTETIAKHLTDFLKKTDRFAKTIVFCVDQEHASEMRIALNNLNADLVQQFPDYVWRVTADEGDVGRGHMQRFQDVETRTPVILTTSQLLTTGLDAPICRNIVLVRLVNSMVEFKQIIGRGTRVRDDYGKLWFNILDYTGSATRNFADPAFDGDPAFATQEEIDEDGKIKNTEVETPEVPEDEDGEINEPPGSTAIIDPPPNERRKFYYDGGQVEIAADLVYELDADGKQLRVVKLTDYTGDKVRSICPSTVELRARWSNPEQRTQIIEQLHERGIDFQTLAIQAGKPDADLRDVVNKIAGIHFTSSDELHTLGALYESMLREMRDAAGDSGEFYTPRAVVRFMVTVTDPRLGEKVLDPASGTGGFLVEAFDHLSKQVKTVADRKVLQTQSLFGCEPKPLPYLLCQMNLLLHGLDAPQIDPGNALRHKLTDIGERDRVDVILTNPPFGGEEERGIQGNFPEDKQTAETALLFLQLIMRKLRRGSSPVAAVYDRRNDGGGGRRSQTAATSFSRAAVVVPNGTLFGDGVCARIKEELLKEFNLHTIVRLPNGVFAPYTSIPTNLLFFDRSGPTREVWYYEQPLPEGRKNYTKTAPIQFEEFAPLVAWWDQPGPDTKRKENERAWKVPAAELLANGCNLDRKNPRAREDIAHLPPEQLAADILKKEQRIAEIMGNIRNLLAKHGK